MRVWIASLVGALALVAAEARAAGGGGRACFGGVPETAASGVYNPGDLTVIGRSLYASGSGLQQVDLGTGRVTSVDPFFHGGIIAIGAIDAREAYVLTGQNEIFAFDLIRKRARKVVAGHLSAESVYPMVEEPFLLDARYFYYGQEGGNYSTHAGTGLYRVRRDGLGSAEFLGMPPGVGFQGGVVVDRDFVYYRWGSRKDGFAIVRRRLKAGSPEQTLVKLQHPSGRLLKIYGQRIYYVDDHAIWSVPVGGGVPAARLVTTGDAALTDLLVEPGCLYWADGRKIRRLALDRSAAVPEIIADEQDYQEDVGVSERQAGRSVLASDGRFLYWPDRGGERIMRARRDPHPPPPRPELVAAWVAGGLRPPVKIDGVTVGDGWGCAHFREEGASRWQCWSAAPARDIPPARIAAKDVPWLIGDQLAAAPDRLCAPLGEAAKCWPWPEVARRRPDDMPQKPADWANLRWLHVGGTFSCTNPWGVWSCFGDDRYGQLADGKKNVGLFGDSGALGLWHGCMSVGTEETFCWGRGDALQLGFDPPDRCGSGAERVPCSRSAHQVEFKLPAQSYLRAADLFTCAASSTQGLACWGASRDGLFGTAAACPAGLKDAWPTRAGRVAAPGATCARTPSPVRAFSRPTDWLSVGPRGICTVDGKPPRCVGAIATPAGDVNGISVGSGDQPAACGIAGAQAVCWGAGYSPAGSPAVLVPVDLDRPPVAGAAVLDLPPPPGSTWDASCKVRFGCDQPTAPLRTCPRGAVAEPWSALVAKAPSLVGTTVRVQGPLALGWLPRERGFKRVPSHNGVARESRCSPGECCNRRPRPVVIGGAEEKLSLTSLQCAGDDSRVCCNVPALGQAVIAAGVLQRAGPAGWQLASPEVCAIAAGN